MQSVQALASSLLGVFSEVLTALPDHTAPPCSFLLGRAALSAASSGLASVPYPGCDEVEDRAVYISLAKGQNRLFLLMEVPLEHLLDVNNVQFLLMLQCHYYYFLMFVVAMV